jgi:hypothetical protein
MKFRRSFPCSFKMRNFSRRTPTEFQFDSRHLGECIMCKPSITISKLPRNFSPLCVILIGKKMEKTRMNKYFPFPVALHLCNNSFSIVLFFNLTEQKVRVRLAGKYNHNNKICHLFRHREGEKELESESNCFCRSSGSIRIMRKLLFSNIPQVHLFNGH